MHYLRLALVLVLVPGRLLSAQGGAEGEVARFRDSVEDELRGNILPFWLEHVPHPERDGFHGAVGRDGRPLERAPRAALMTSRILWTFSAAYRMYGADEYRAMAERAARDLERNFRDQEHGGYFWSLTPAGAPLNDGKHLYGQAFAMYALAEYHRATGDPLARARALELFDLVERHAADRVNGGYLESFTRDWRPVPAGQPSPIGPPELKSQNTHLHLMEAFASLLRATDEPRVRAAQRDLITLVLDRIVDPRSAHLGLFFAAVWTPRSSEISYGHDIEFAWLVTEAATELGDTALIERARPLAVRVAEVTLEEGVMEDGGIPYEANAEGRPTMPHREWWVPAEAAVGFLNAYQLSGDERFLSAARQQWDYIQRHFVDREHGEWFHSVSADGRVAMNHPKADAWKCPYHNGRACMELVRRLGG